LQYDGDIFRRVTVAAEIESAAGLDYRERARTGRRRVVRANPVPALPLAAKGVGHVVLFADRIAGAAVRGVRDDMEHLLDAGTVSGLQPPVALDLMSSLRRVVVARRLVRVGRSVMSFTAEDAEDSRCPYPPDRPLPALQVTKLDRFHMSVDDGLRPVARPA
jgi:hypothetical protein